MLANPKKSRCRTCRAVPKCHKGIGDSDFIACECKGPLGGYCIVIYGGWNLPLEWRLNRWYALRFHMVRLLKSLLAV